MILWGVWGNLLRNGKNHVPGRLSGNMISRGVWGKPCSWKAFWEHDFAGCLGGPLGASQGVPSGPVELSLGPMEGVAGLVGSLWMASGSRLGPSAHPATVPGLWLRGLLSVRWDLVVRLSGASGQQF